METEIPGSEFIRKFAAKREDAKLVNPVGNSNEDLMLEVERTQMELGWGGDESGW